MRVRLKFERLAEEMAKSRLTTNGWARRLGLSSGHLSQLANGRRLHPNAKTREKLLDGLGLDFEDLFEIESPPEPEAPSADGAGFSDRGSPQPLARNLPRRKESAVSSFLSVPFREAALAARALIRRPGYSLAVVLNLALGLGVTLALFQFVYPAMFAPYGYDRADRLLTVYTTQRDRPGSIGAFSLLDGRDVAERTAEVVDLAFWDWEPVALAGGSRPLRLESGYVTANFQRALGVDLIAGRWFTPEEREARAAVVVVGERLWRDAFDRDPGIVGRVVRLDGSPTEVVGVVSSTMDFPGGAELWLPLPPPGDPTSRSSRWLGAIGRLQGDATLEQAVSAMDRAMIQVGEEYPEDSGDLGVVARTMREDRVSESRGYSLSILGLIAILLVLGGANLASLLSTRTVARRQELAVRSALGAGRMRLARELMVENTLLGVVGLGVALGLSAVLTRLLFAAVPSGELPSWMSPRFDGRVLFVALLVGGVLVLLSSAYPLWVHLRPARLGMRGGTSDLGLGRMRAMVIVLQVTLCFALLVGAGQLVSHLMRLSQTPSGWQEENAVLVGLDLLSTRSASPVERRSRFLRFQESLEELPGVTAVGTIDRLPLSGRFNRTGFSAETPGASEYDFMAQLNQVTPGYFAAAGMRFEEGESFDFAEAADVSRWGEADPEEVAVPRTVVISRRVADSVWPGASPIGQRIKFARPDQEAPWYEVRGVVSDVRNGGLHRDPTSGIYVTAGSFAMSRGAWLLRVDDTWAGAMDRFVGEVRGAIREVDPTQPVHRVDPLAEFVRETLWEERFFAVVFWVFGIMATALAALGLYGVLAYTVTLRRHELGIRMALGASSAAVGAMVVRRALALVGVGLLLGLPLALAQGRFLQDVMSASGSAGRTSLLLIAALCLLVTAAVAAWVPSRRAARIEPVEILEG